MKLTEYRVGEVMTLIRRPVDVTPEGTYREIGIRSFGNGVFHKPPVSGEELGSKRVFYIEPGDLLFSNVFAWEGAVALASDQDAGRIGSHRFMTYQVNTTKADPRYLLHYFYGGPGLQTIRQASPGSAGRNRTLGISTFERHLIQLPPLDEQRRIADKLNIALYRQKATISASNSRAKTVHSMINAMEQKVFEDGLADGWKLMPLGELAEVAPRTRRPDGNEKVSFVPMAALNDVTGSIEEATYKDAAEVGNGYTLFRRGDVIFARITPCMQNGKCAVFDDSGSEYGFGSTEFHVIRPADATQGRWIHRFLRTRRFRDSAIPHMTGTAGQQRVPASYLQRVQIPVPLTTKEQECALTMLDKLQAQRLRFRTQHLLQQETLKALHYSLLNAAFSGRLQEGE